MSKHGVYYTKSPLLASRTPVWRSRFVIFFLAMGFISLIARASWVQLFEYGHLKEEADKRYVRTLSLPASRGEIKDRNGITLASSVETPSLWVSPLEIRNSNDEALDEKLKKMIKLLGLSSKKVTELNEGIAQGKEFVWLERKVDADIIEQIQALKIKGVRFRTESEYSRNYPGNEVTAHILGMTDADEIGIEGVELAYNDLLKGQPGYVQYIRDRVGNSVAAAEKRQAPVNGKDIQLSIDRRIQYFAFEALKKTVKDLQAVSGSAVVIDVQTGEVLSLVNYPSYSPADRKTMNRDRVRNRAVTDAFEPGSTIKPIVVAKALDLGIVKPDTMINTVRGSLTVSGKVIRDVSSHPQLSVEQVIQKSSNIGVARIAMQMTPQDMWEAFKALGFGKEVYTGFPGEVKGILHSYMNWRPMDQAAQSYGYGLTVSLLQLGQAYTVFARQGDIIPLTILRNETPVKGIPVFTPQTSMQVRRMLHMTTLNGEAGRRAQIEGYSVGGKSGTTRQLSKDGNYESDRYRAWYVGLAPIDNPRLVVAILIDSPNKDKERGGYYGGVAAAPIFAEIMQGSLRFMGVTPDVRPNTLEARVSNGGAQMKKLNTPQAAVQWLQEKLGKDFAARKIGVDSRQLSAGDAFIAWPGAAVDGRDFVQGLLDENIAACLVEANGAQGWAWAKDERIALYEGLRKDVSQIASLYFDEPSKALDVVAITGTNGKTSTAWWLAQALTLLNKPCGMIGTLGIGSLHRLEASALTTPDPISLHKGLRQMLSDGAQACAVEASSIGIEEHRFDDVKVKVAVFTNLSQDHLDYHKTMEAYWQAKQKLFAWPQLQAAVINIEAPYGAMLAQFLTARLEQVVTYKVVDAAKPCDKENTATLTACNIQYAAQGMVFDVYEGKQKVTVHSELVGKYNIANILAVLGSLRVLGHGLEEAIRACNALPSVPGRMQEVFSLKPNTPKVLVDYAHTPDALMNALLALRPLTQARKGKLWCVFGCGGARDNSKRPLMGEVAQQYADQVMVTSDNPRTEEAKSIIEQITAPIKQYKNIQVEADRKKAIASAIQQADAKDVVLIAGKGHEPYQEIKGVRYPFFDVAVAGKELNKETAFAKAKAYMLTLGQVKDLLRSQGIASRLFGGESVQIMRVHSDTRSLQAGDLFVALKGENFDAHDFMVQAIKQGASAVLAEHGLQQAGAAGLEVENVKKALSALAIGWRACFDLPVIAVTGSNGKTTTTQMIASILKAWQGDAALATRGNLNNDIGVPLSVLRLNAQHQVAVFELGMNHVGEIAALAHMVEPQVALVNNAQREHLEFMQTVQAVAKENGQVISALPQEGIAIFPSNDAYTQKWKNMSFERQQVMFSLKNEGEAAYFVLDQVWEQDAWALTVHTPEGNIDCRLHSAGVHNIKNALAAIACAQQAGAPLVKIAEGMNHFKPVSGRSQVELLDLGETKITLIDDTYNANPDSVRAAIDVLAGLPQPSLLVLGEMGEVGTQAQEFHREVGLYAKEKNISRLWGTGALVKETVNAFGAQGQFFESMEDLMAKTLKEGAGFASILVKGSRYTKMERAVVVFKSLGSHLKGGHDVA